jgi:hypothetical protein
MRRLFIAAAIVGLCALVQPSPLQAQGKDKAAKPAAKAKVMEATGMVKSVSGTSLTISSGGKDMTFTIDNDTKFVGKGLSTKSATKQGKMTATDAVGVNDRVSVSYHDMGGTMHAADVKILSKAPGKK